MRVYLVRHEETEHNANKLYMSPDVPLSEVGLKQAEDLANRLKKLPVDLILSSPYERAKQTADIISKHLEKEVQVEEDLKEIVRPSFFHHRSWTEPEISEIRDLIIEKWGDKDFHHSDEENFPELLKRGLNIISKLENLNAEHVVVVTHEGFMKMILAALVFGADLNSKLFDELYEFLRVSNTGITICDRRDGEWKLVTWNDHAHLG